MLSYTSRKCWKKIPRILGSSESESELPRTNFKLVIFLFTSCSDIVMRSALTANFMYCRPWVPATIYFINKVLFYQYMRNGSRVMMQCLCYIKTYISARFFPSQNFISLRKVTLFFLSEPNIPIKALCLKLVHLILQLPPPLLLLEMRRSRWLTK